MTEKSHEVIRDEGEKAYLVTAGSYSDYRVEAVFLSEDEAKAFLVDKFESEISGWFRDSGRIEEYTIGHNNNWNGREIYEVSMTSDGKWHCEAVDEYWLVPDDVIVRSERSVGQSVSKARWTYHNFVVTKRGKDVALKIAQDQFYRIKNERLEQGKV